MSRHSRERADDAHALADEACRLHAGALEAREAGDPQAARRAAQAALGKMIRAAGARHPDVANIALELARAERDCGRLARAEVLARRATVIANAFARSRIADVVRIRVQAMAALASLLVARGAWGEARAIYARATRVATRLGPHDADLAAVLNDHAVLCKFEGRLAHAARLYARAIAVVRGGPGDDDAEATLLHNLAGLDHARGLYARAAAYARRGLSRRARAVGEDHPKYACDLAGYAAILAGLERFRDAKPRYERAIRILERAFGPNHPEIAYALSNLAAAFEATGDFRRAKACYARSLAIARRTTGLANVDVALTLHNMSVLARRMGDARASARLHARALRLAERVVGRRHPRYAEIARAGEA